MLKWSYFCSYFRYGSHLAYHMSLGFLFLGGGRYSLGTSNMAIAALIISCFPQFPTHSNDNRYHLQVNLLIFFKWKGFQMYLKLLKNINFWMQKKIELRNLKATIKSGTTYIGGQMAKVPMCGNSIDTYRFLPFVLCTPM